MSVTHSPVQVRREEIMPWSTLSWSYDGDIYPSGQDLLGWTAGTLNFSNDISYAISADTDTFSDTKYLYWDIASSGIFQFGSAIDSVGNGIVPIGVGIENTESGQEASLRVFQGPGLNITADNIATNTLSAITADMGTLTAGEIVGGSIRTSFGTNYVEMDSTGIKGYNASLQRFYLSSDGSGWLGSQSALSWSSLGNLIVADITASTGTIAAFDIAVNSLTSTLVGIHSAAYSEGAEILLGHATLYASAKVGLKADGSGKVADGNFLWDTSGNVTMSGTFTSDAIITGGIIQTDASPNQRIILNEGGTTNDLRFYNGSNNEVVKLGVNIDGGFNDGLLIQNSGIIKLNPLAGSHSIIISHFLNRFDYFGWGDQGDEYFGVNVQCTQQGNPLSAEPSVFTASDDSSSYNSGARTVALKGDAYSNYDNHVGIVGDAWGDPSSGYAIGLWGQAQTGQIQLRLGLSNYSSTLVDFKVDSDGYLTIDASGNRVNLPAGHSVYIGTETVTEAKIQAWDVPDDRIIDGVTYTATLNNNSGTLEFDINNASEGTFSIDVGQSANTLISSAGTITIGQELIVSGDVDATGSIDADGSYQMDGSDIIDTSGYQTGVLKTRQTLLFGYNTAVTVNADENTWDAHTVDGSSNTQGYRMLRAGKVAGISIQLSVTASSPDSTILATVQKNGVNQSLAVELTDSGSGNQGGAATGSSFTVAANDRVNVELYITEADDTNFTVEDIAIVVEYIS